MTVRSGIYKCERCGNIVEVLHEGVGELVCCGQPMKLYESGTVDASREKHVPVIEKTESGFRVTIGSVAHPMSEDHYIEWIELAIDGVSYRRFLSPGDRAVAEFCADADKAHARAYCNLHGLWQAEYA